MKFLKKILKKQENCIKKVIGFNKLLFWKLKILRKKDNLNLYYWMILYDLCMYGTGYC
jgi:hypothetical protein